MPTPRELKSVVKVVVSALFVLLLLSEVLPAQTNVNDVHVESRDVAPSDNAGGIPIELLSNLGLAVIKTAVKLVLVPVSVTDTNQRFVTGLSQDNFQIFEGKTPQSIQHFPREDVPVSIGIILDVSGSMGDKVERLREAVNQFCNAANPQDEFFLITFADQPRVVADFTTSAAEIERELVFTQPKGRTSLLDAIHMGLRKMKEARNGKRRYSSSPTGEITTVALGRRR